MCVRMCHYVLFHCRTPLQSANMHALSSYRAPEFHTSLECTMPLVSVVHVHMHVITALASPPDSVIMLSVRERKRVGLYVCLFKALLKWGCIVARVRE